MSGFMAVVVGAFLGAGAMGCLAGREVRLDPSVRKGLSGEATIHVVGYEPISALRIVRLGGGVELAQRLADSFDRFPLEDPVRDVERIFLEGLERELGLGSALVVEGPHLGSGHVPAIGADIESLRAAFGRGLVLDLETFNWQLTFVRRSFIDNANTTYGLDFSIRARLVRLSDSTILWQGLCSFTRNQGARPLRELVAEDLKLLKARRTEVAEACAAELLGSFMGRTELSIWSGRNVPR